MQNKNETKSYLLNVDKRQFRNWVIFAKWKGIHVSDLLRFAVEDYIERNQSDDGHKKKRIS